MRRLAAILVADAVGYSKAMEDNEGAAVTSLENSRGVIDPAISKYSGRIVTTAGDSVVAEFSSTVLAVQAAVEIQETLSKTPETEAFRFRIGVHFGDVLVRGSDLIGDGVNVAARLESIAPAGGVCISGTVAEQIAGKVEASFALAG